MQMVFHCVDKVRRIRLSREVRKWPKLLGQKSSPSLSVDCCRRHLRVHHKSSIYLSPLQGKIKAEKNRQKVEEQFLKASHAQRQEAAQQRREDKRRAEKERIMNEEDPEKQRKWEVCNFSNYHSFKKSALRTTEGALNWVQLVGVDGRGLIVMLQICERYGSKTRYCRGK